MTTQPAYYPISVVAKQLGIARQTVYNAIKRGTLTKHTFVDGGMVYVVNDQKLRTQRRNAQRKVTA